MPKVVTVNDEEYQMFVASYPAARRVGGGLARRAFARAMQGRNGEHLAAMMAALEQHKRSEQWQRGIVPLMTTWLNQERWVQVLPEGSKNGPRVTAQQPAWIEECETLHDGHCETSAAHWRKKNGL